MRISVLALSMLFTGAVSAQNTSVGNPIKAVTARPDYDAAMVVVEVESVRQVPFLAEVSFEGQVVASGESDDGSPLKLRMPEDFLRWTPDHPFLYDLKINALYAGTIGKAETCFAMRKFGTERDEGVTKRFTLNGLPIFLFGPLYDCASLSNDSVRREVQRIKDLGYNMIRFHGEMQSPFLCQLCDSIGLIVWTDASDEVSFALKSVPTVEVSVPMDEPDMEKATDTYLERANKIYLMAFQGYSAAVFGRFADSETDHRGLMTEDRMTLKMNEQRLLQINRKIGHALAE